MLTKSLLVLKKYAFLILFVYASLLTAGSLSNTGGMPELGSNFDDKIYHFFAYTIFTFLTYNFLSRKNINYKITYSAITVLLYGIIIEVLQHVLTANRTLDAIDVLANFLGILSAVFMLLLRQRIFLKMNA
ncbi:MAG: VanZ family protein [Bacteroidota bacterium]